MNLIHVANTDFEFELADPSSYSIPQSQARFLHCLQLQYLPLLYAGPNEKVIVTSLPDEKFIEHLLSLKLWKQEELPQCVEWDRFAPSSETTCQSWGYSNYLKKWALKTKILYEMPDWEVVRIVNSKEFSFEFNRNLEGARLIYSREDLKTWFKDWKGPKLLKTCFGFSGKGHFFINPDHPIDPIIQFCEKEWKQHRPLIGEPWLDRLFDFSTQWYLSKEGMVQYIGATVFETLPNGSYVGTKAGPSPLIFQPYESYLNEHLDFVKSVLQTVVDKGYFGYVGIDAFLYRHSNQIKLYPVVEINARRTMSLVALLLQKRWFPDQAIQLNYTATEEGSRLLPSSITDKKKGILQFRRQLFFKKI